MNLGQYVSLSLNFSTLRASQAGLYTCRANIFGELAQTLENLFSLTLTRKNKYFHIELHISQDCVQCHTQGKVTMNVSSYNTLHFSEYCIIIRFNYFNDKNISYFIFTVPKPVNIFVAKVENLPTTAGLNFTFTCTVSLPNSIDTPVTADAEWLKSGGEETLPTDRVTVTNATKVTAAIFTSSISFHPLTFDDSGTYTCRMTFTPHLSTYLSSGPPATTTYTISVESKNAFFINYSIMFNFENSFILLSFYSYFST